MADPDDTLSALTAAAEGLLMPSESDEPFEAFRWPDDEPLTPEALRAYLGYPREISVETRSLNDFFSLVAEAREWMDEGQLSQAGHFAALRDRIAALLDDVVVYRVSRI